MYRIAIGVMLTQNPNNTIDKPIYYANQLMIRVEKNYSTTKKEALVMIYVTKKICHYLLGNNFAFFYRSSSLDIFTQQTNCNHMNNTMAIIIAGI
jgi:hypothetical protein